LPTKSSRPSRRIAYVGLGITLSDGEGRTLTEPPFCSALWLVWRSADAAPNWKI
jgi:hypothetical protein